MRVLQYQICQAAQFIEGKCIVVISGLTTLEIQMQRAKKHFGYREDGTDSCKMRHSVCKTVIVYIVPF